MALAEGQDRKPRNVSKMMKNELYVNHFVGLIRDYLSFPIGDPRSRSDSRNQVCALNVLQMLGQLFDRTGPSTAMGIARERGFETDLPQGHFGFSSVLFKDHGDPGPRVGRLPGGVDLPADPFPAFRLDDVDEGSLGANFF